MILLHGESYNVSTTLPEMAAGGKAYASRSSMADLVHPLLWPGNLVKKGQLVVEPRGNKSI